MGNENTILTPAAIRHVFRRSGFGAVPIEIARTVRKLPSNPTRGQLADQLLNFRAKKFKPPGRDLNKAHNAWVKRLITFNPAVQAKLVIFWHDHFSVANSVVVDMRVTARYVRALHEQAVGNFKQLVKEINTTAAMMEMLDTVRNKKAEPNENYARETLELFTLGVNDFKGNPNYTQDDIVQIARAYTGWDYYGRGTPIFHSDQHDFEVDFPGRGPKQIFGSVGGFGGPQDFTVNGEGESEIDTITDLIFAHTDTDGKNTVARYLTRRLLEFYAHDAFATESPGAAETAVIDQIISDSSFDVSFEIKPLLRSIFVHDVFYETMSPPGPGTLKSVKFPIDYVVSTMKLLKMRFKGRYTFIPGGSYLAVLDHLTNMGQILMEPPSVFGWEWETSWTSSSTLLARYNFARDIIATRGGGKFRPDRLIDVSLTDPGAIADAVTDLLGLDGQLSPDERQILIDYLTDQGMNPTLDLRDEDVRNKKLNGLFGLVLQSPKYQLH